MCIDVGSRPAESHCQGLYLTCCRGRVIVDEGCAKLSRVNGHHVQKQFVFRAVNPDSCWQEFFLGFAWASSTYARTASLCCVGSSV